MSTVAITGAGGYIARQLILSLENQEWCRKILGTDIVEPGVQSAKFEFRNYDIRDPLLLDFWKDQGVDTLVHLAFIVDPIHDEKKMYDVNVNGTLNVLRICEELNIGHIIVASSGTAYGAWPDNPESLKEEDPIRIFPPKFSYAHHKGLIEQHCAGFIKQHPDVVFNIVRPCVVYGPHTDNYLSRFLKNLPVIFLAGGCDPNFQFVHEEDLTQLFSLIIEKKLPGPFNAAGDGVVKISEAGALIGKRTQKIPRHLYRAFIWLLWHLRVKIVEAPAGMVDFTSYPWVLDTTRAKTILGWKPHYTSMQTLRIMLETHDYYPVENS